MGTLLWDSVTPSRESSGNRTGTPQWRRGLPTKRAPGRHSVVTSLPVTTHRNLLASLSCLVLFAVVVDPGVAAAQGDAVRRDPKGITGATPFWEQVKEGDNAFIAGDFSSATAKYEAAIKLEPRNPLAHSRLAQALVAKGDLEAAFDRLEVAARFATQLAVRAKIQFLQADIRERQAKFAQAKTRWEAYQKLVSDLDAKTDAQGKVYPDSAAERIKQIDAKAVRETDYAEVKTRIEKREKELTAK